MGSSTSKQNQNNFLQAYDIIQQNKAQHIKFLQHKITHDEYLLKEFNFTSVKQCHKMMDRLTQLRGKLAGNRHVVELKDFLMSSEEQYCATFYKIYALFQYPMRTLDDEIGERRLQKKSFTEPELWSILASCVAGLNHLQRNGIKHEALKSNNIILSHEGIIKVADPFVMNLPSNYQSLLTKRSSKQIYPSPEQAKALQQELINPAYNRYKADVFTLGIIMLQAGLLENQDEECYRDEKYRLHWDTLKYNLDRLGTLYSQEMKGMLEFMLAEGEDVRPDWQFLNTHYMDATARKRDSFVQEQAIKQPSMISSQAFSIKSLPKSQVRGKPEIPSNSSLMNQTPRGFSYGVQQRPISNEQRIPCQSIPVIQLPRATLTFGSQIPIQSAPHMVLPSSRISANQRSSIQYVVATPQNSGPGYRQSFEFYSQSPVQFTIPPLNPSIIENTRPLKNIFPADSYQIKTRFEDNIIKVQQHESRKITKLVTEQNTIVHPPGSEPQSYAVNIFNPSTVSNYIPSEPNRFPSYSSPVQASSTITNGTQNKTIPMAMGMSKPFQMLNQSAQDQPEYVVQYYEKGSRYEGYKWKGMRHGKGKFYYQDGGMYDGDWKENMMEGYGKLYYQSDKLAYEGQWKHDQFCGRGVIYNQDSEPLAQGFDYTDFDGLEEYWVKYQGEFIDDSKYGRGVLYLSNGQKFQGYFRDDQVEGPGTFYSQNGTRIQGTWSQNHKIA